MNNTPLSGNAAKQIKFQVLSVCSKKNSLEAVCNKVACWVTPFGLAIHEPGHSHTCKCLHCCRRQQSATVLCLLLSTWQIVSTSCLPLCTTYHYNPYFKERITVGTMGSFPFPNCNKTQWVGAAPVLKNRVESFTATGTRIVIRK